MRIILHARARLDLAYASLDGLSVGDALGAPFFMVGRSLPDLVAGRPPRGPWEWTDDTEMACNLVTELRDHGEYVLGNGSRVTAQDTVPFALWVAAHHLDDYHAAITACVKAGGDVDNTGAIVGGIVAAAPEEWRDEREPLPEWVSR